MRFFVYLVVGVVAWLVDLAAYHMLWPLLGIAVAQLIARIAGAVTAFLLNRIVTFSASSDHAMLWPQAARYTALLALNWALTVGLIYILSYGLGLNPLWAKIIVDIIIVPGNYLFMKSWVFAPTSGRADP